MSEPKSQAWAIDIHATRRASVFYFVVRGFIRHILARWLRLRTAGLEHLAIEGPVILASVHRSNLDAPLIAGVSPRRIRALGKESLFKGTVPAWINSALGAIPVLRGGIDREAMRATREIIGRGEMMIIFPEGSRQSGDTVDGVFDGTSYLAHKTGAPIIPIGIAGTETAMRAGSKGIHRAQCAIVVGAPLAPPVGRLSRPALARYSSVLSAELQTAFDSAIALAAIGYDRAHG